MSPLILLVLCKIAMLRVSLVCLHLVLNLNEFNEHTWCSYNFLFDSNMASVALNSSVSVFVSIFNLRFCCVAPPPDISLTTIQRWCCMTGNVRYKPHRKTQLVRQTAEDNMEDTAVCLRLCECWDLLCFLPHRSDDETLDLSPQSRLLWSCSVNRKLVSTTRVTLSKDAGPVAALILHLSFHAASLRVAPNKLQFFEYDSVRFYCSGRSTCKVKRWVRDKVEESTCEIRNIYCFESGEYWCDAEAGRRLHSINITVTGTFPSGQWDVGSTCVLSWR